MATPMSWLAARLARRRGWANPRGRAPRVVQLQGLGDAAEDLARGKVAHPGRSALAGHDRTQHRVEAGPRRGIPDVDEERGEPDAETVDARGEQQREGRGGVERQLQRGLEDPVLGVE